MYGKPHYEVVSFLYGWYAIYTNKMTCVCKISRFNVQLSINVNDFINFSETWYTSN